MLPTDVYVKAAVKGLLFHRSNRKLIFLSILMTIIAIIDVGVRNNFWDFKDGYWGFVNLQAISDYCGRQANKY